MTNVDQFESVFRSASKAVFEYERAEFARGLIVTDLDEPKAYEHGESVKSFLGVLGGEGGTAWDVVKGSDFDSIESLLALIAERPPDLICTYRHLHSTQWRQPFSLGDYVEVLTQATQHPVLVLPHPKAKRASAHALQNTNVVMAMTDRLTGDSDLVNAAARFTEDNGVLFLTHVEDQAAFTRIIEAISKIPTIDTDHAIETITAQLLKEPVDFIASCRAGLAEARLSVHVEEIVVMDHHLAAYRRLVEEHHVDLLVMNTKDEDQLAMHGMAYPLAVELREIPLLML